MLRSCQYCGRIHDRKFNCGKKPVYQKKRTDIDTFRSSKAWQRKREQIRQRDLNLCRVCFSRGLYIYDNLSVHHIIPIDQDYEKRLDEGNLITLCDVHHEMAENGEIDAETLKMLIPPMGMS